MSDGKVVFEIQGDPKGINTTLKNVTASIEKESKNWDQAVDKSTSSMGNSFTDFLKGVAKGFSAYKIGKMILDIGKAAISAASDLQEVQNVVDVTFGDSASKIESWSKKAGKAYGLTELQAKQYTSTLGAMMKSQGIAGDEIVNMSTDLAGLAADMASFYNLDFDTAFEKIRSGITGQTEPLKQLGINMSVANLEAFALEQGLTKSYTAMSQGEQTHLRYQYLMKSTADAQGDFARTSDGLANSTRRLDTALESIKTTAGGLFISDIATIADKIATTLEKMNETRDQTAYDLAADIDKKTAESMENLEATYQKASDIIGIIGEIQSRTIKLADGSKQSFTELFASVNSDDELKEKIDGLGYDTDYIVNKYRVWEESTKRLTSLIPSLASAIDSETGSIYGNTDAIQKNIDEWRANEEKKLAWSAYYAKARAIEEKKGAMYTYELDAGAAQKAFERQKQRLETIYGANINDNGIIVNYKMENAYAEARGYDTGEAFQKDLAEYRRLRKEMENARKAYTAQTSDLTLAEQELADTYAYLTDTYGELSEAETKAADGAVAWTDAQKEAGKSVLDSLSALNTYVESVHDATEKTVDGIVKGFETLERPTTDLEKKRDRLIEQQNELNRSTKDGEKRYQELQSQIDELNRSMSQYSPKGMQDALKSQLAFMDEYLKNLEKARAMGLSDSLLAYLSDGSAESAEYLASLVTSPQQASEVDALFQQVQARKGEFTDTLTAQKLTVDDTYQGMVDTANEAIAALDLGDQAADAMSNTVQGIARGIADNVDGVSDAVDEIIAQLDRLNAYGINVNLGSFGMVTFGAGGSSPSSDSPFLNGVHETGLDYVPFDGYLAGLHEGEGILTAEENRIWQRFKNGSSPQSVDYDALGGVMRENIHAGGNVYLDGRIVGNVISKQQGDSYRKLQRSGWQG